MNILLPLLSVLPVLWDKGDYVIRFFASFLKLLIVSFKANELKHLVIMTFLGFQKWPNITKITSIFHNHHWKFEFHTSHSKTSGTSPSSSSDNYFLWKLFKLWNTSLLTIPKLYQTQMLQAYTIQLYFEFNIDDNVEHTRHT